MGVGLAIIAIVGLLIGVLVGLPGRYEQTPEDIERIMAAGGGTRTKRVKRQVSPVAWLQRKLTPGGPPPKRRRAFKLEAPGVSGAAGKAPRREAVARDGSPTERGDATGDRDRERRKPRTRNTLRDGRFKLRPPGEGDR